MHLIIRLSFIILAPVMVIIYLWNSYRNVEDIHAHYSLNYAE
jgi:hypothetical protein